MDDGAQTVGPEWSRVLQDEKFVFIAVQIPIGHTNIY